MAWRDDPHGHSGRDESRDERDDRNLLELLQELRVAGLGVQVLFGFLLSLPFTSRFSKLSGTQRDLYVADVLLAAIAIALLVAPVAYHRLVFRQHQKEPLIHAANIMALAGLGAVALAVTLAVLLVLGFVGLGGIGIVIGVLTGCFFGALWYAIPLIRRRRAERS